ncbi:MAG: ABC transporter permease, partial [Ilumatobacter sp.]|nr:ABC transporter permease [Ilumatobacter sp.]
MADVATERHRSPRARSEWEQFEGFSAAVRSQRSLAWRRFRHHRLALVSAAVLAVFVALCAAAPWIAPFSYTDQDLSSTFTGPDGRYWLGTDSLGRDQLSRLLYGGRVSLAVGFGVAIVGGAFGTLVGSVAGYFGGAIDNALMRFTDFMLALPALIFLIVAARIFGDSIVTVVLLVAAVTWMPLARIVR